MTQLTVVFYAFQEDADSFIALCKEVNERTKAKVEITNNFDSLSSVTQFPGEVTRVSKIQGCVIQIVKIPPINPDKFLKSISFINPENFLKIIPINPEILTMLSNK